MKIELISKSDYNTIIELSKEHPILIYQNEGYDYLNKANFSNEENKSFDRISEILKDSIVGFIKFNNLKLLKNGELVARFQYNYGAEDNSMYFVGVGYIAINELLNGFNKD